MMPRGDRCHAIFVADTPPMLMVLDARLHLIGPTGEKEIPVGDFYRQDGMKGGTFSEGEILTKIKIPFKKRLKLSYVRTSARKAIDFPEPGVAVAIELGERSQITNIRVAATGLLSKPIRLNSVEKSLMREGEIVSSPEKLEISLKGLTVLPHHGVSVWYRREMFKVLVKRAIAGAMSKDKS
jgi:CO/xanthine dehydrogenase FAD-binding subunit